jgi:hypothetical protein
MLVHSLFLFFGSNVDFVNCKILGDWVLFSVSFLLKDQKTKQNKKLQKANHMVMNYVK